MLAESAYCLLPGMSQSVTEIAVCIFYIYSTVASYIISCIDQRSVLFVCSHPLPSFSHLPYFALLCEQPHC